MTKKNSIFHASKKIVLGLMILNSNIFAGEITVAAAANVGYAMGVARRSSAKAGSPIYYPPMKQKGHGMTGCT
jgi:hypothetical protein